MKNLNLEFLTADSIEDIKTISGQDALTSYLELCQEFVKRIGSLTSPLTMNNILQQWHHCAEITDLEVLCDILGSSKKRIIVYAGYAHCLPVTRFLEKHGFVVTEDKESALLNEKIITEPVDGTDDSKCGLDDFLKGEVPSWIPQGLRPEELEFLDPESAR